MGLSLRTSAEGRFRIADLTDGRSRRNYEIRSFLVECCCSFVRGRSAHEGGRTRANAEWLEHSDLGRESILDGYDPAATSRQSESHQDIRILYTGWWSHR